MKSAYFAAALLLGGTAMAQTYAPAPITSTPIVEPDATVVTPTTTIAAQVPAGPVVAPDNSNPELDARGIPVISDPAVAPPGFNQPAGVNGMGGPLVDASQPPATQPATQDYPPCSRTITDKCVQTYERGVRRGR